MTGSSVRDGLRGASGRLGPRAPLFALLGLFVAESIWQGIGVGPRVFYDTTEYRRLAGALSVFDARFWVTMRAPGMLLLYDLLGGDARSIVAAQRVLHLLCWGLLAVVLYEKSSNRLVGSIGCAGVLLVALSPQVSLWSYVLLPESISLSLIPVLVASTLELADRGGWKRLASLLFVLGFSTILRDLYGYYAVSFAVPLAVMYAYAAITRRQLVAGVIALVCFAALSSFSANAARHPDVPERLTVFSEKRWYGPFLNTMGSRLLANESAVEYLAAKGMPVDDTLLEKRGMANVLLDPALADFREWALEEGRSAYTAFLLTHPGYAFGSIWEARREVFHTGSWRCCGKEGYAAKGFRVDNLFPYAFDNAHVYAFELLLIGGALVALRIRRRSFRSPRVGVAFAMLAGIPVLAFVGYHGDAMEVFRHTAAVGVALELGLLVVLFALGDRLLTGPQ